jgi:predicted solute-binding protein
MTCDMTVNQATRNEDGCHALRVCANLFIEIAHQYNVMAITAQVGNQGAEIVNEDFPRIGIGVAFKPEHVALLGVRGGTTSQACLLQNLVFR